LKPFFPLSLRGFVSSSEGYTGTPVAFFEREAWQSTCLSVVGKEFENVAAALKLYNLLVAVIGSIVALILYHAIRRAA